MKSEVLCAFAGSIPPLRKRKKSGELYTRPPEIEAKISDLSSLIRQDISERSRILDKSDPAYIPSECLMHFLRESRSDSDQRFFTELYRSLAARIIKSTPRAESLDGKGESLFHKEVREMVLDTFVKLLLSDREGYSESLDFYEVRFDSAVACLRDSAQRQIRRAQKRLIPIEDPDSGELSSAVEAAVGAFDPFSNPEYCTNEYRLRLDAAIDQLPPLQRSVLEMIRNGFPIESKDPGVVSISNTLRKAEKTIRNQRDKAIESLRETLKIPRQP